MRIIAIYVKQFRILKEQLFSFDANYRCSYDSKTSTLRIAYKRRLPEQFFTKTRKQDRLWISGIVGENGSGKSSFAALLQNLTDVHDSELSCLIVCEDEGVLRVYSRGMREAQNIEVFGMPKDGAVPSEIEEFPHGGLVEMPRTPTWIAYYSPVYTTQHPFGPENARFMDVSTTYLLKNPSVVNEDASRYGIPRDALFDAIETCRALEFLSEYRDRIDTHRISKLPLRLPMPLGVDLDEDKYQLEYAYNELMRYRESLHEVAPDLAVQIGEDDDSLDDFFELIPKLVQQAKSSNLVARAAVCFALEYCCSEEIWNYDRIADNDAGKLIQLLEVRTRLGHFELSGLVEEIKSNDSPCIKALGEVLEQVEIICQRYGANALGVRLILADKSALNDLRRLVLLHEKAKLSVNKIGARDFLRFEVAPKTSSGEWAFISSMARYFMVIKKTQGDLIFFLDEAETTLHPKYQRCLVQNLIWFFENFAPERKVQLILASHSPILLSDIPMGNVTFLQRDKSDEGVPCSVCCSVAEERLGFTDTFGANIFDLYNMSFFMDEGSVGAFATDKMKSILSGNVNSQKANLLVRLIGDPFMRGYFEGELSDMGLLNDGDD